MNNSPHSAISRRTVFAGAGAVGALAAAATLLPAAEKAPSQVAQAKPEPETGGYQLTDHVKQYYATAKI